MRSLENQQINFTSWTYHPVFFHTHSLLWHVMMCRFSLYLEDVAAAARGYLWHTNIPFVCHTLWPSTWPSTFLCNSLKVDRPTPLSTYVQCCLGLTEVHPCIKIFAILVHPYTQLRRRSETGSLIQNCTWHSITWQWSSLGVCVYEHFLDCKSTTLFLRDGC